jgi:DNA repair protein RecN (Recombination protein N)
MNAEKIIEKLNTAYSSLNGSFSVIEQITKARNAISRANEIVNNKYSQIEESLENTLYTLNDTISEIESSSEDISLNQNEIDNIETRLYHLRDLAKKHNTQIDLLPEKLEELKSLLNNIQYGQSEINELKQLLDVQKKDYITKATNLSNLRQKSAETLDKYVAKELPALKMEKARFKTEISKKEETAKKEFWFRSYCVLSMVLTSL